MGVVGRVSASDSGAAPVLEVVDVSKRFSGVQALDAVSLSVARGEIHGLVGENGAGKSTLLNVVGGVSHPDAGSVRVNGRVVGLLNPTDAQRLGITFVHQELSLFPALDVATNLLISDLPSHASVFVDRRATKDTARKVLARVGLGHIDPDRLVRDLRPGERQLVEIARCLVQRTNILVLDEPTSSLTEGEIERLFQLIRDLRSQGVSVLYVSHRLNEVFVLCDRVTVLRDGRRVGTVRVDEIDNAGLIEMILGHSLVARERGEAPADSREVLRVENLTRGRAVLDVTFGIRAGEIVGLAGVLGSGRTEVARLLFGLDRLDEGAIFVHGAKAAIGGPADAIRLGMGFVTEDRHREGLVLEKPLVDNIVLASLSSLRTWFGWMRARAEEAAAERQRKSLKIAAPTVRRLVKYLSGGNQQKVVIAKWLETHPEIFILDEPTRGIDVGTKEEVYHLIIDLAAAGAAILFISSEIPELVRLCNRVLVMRSGRIVAQLVGDAITAQSVLASAVGVQGESGA